MNKKKVFELLRQISKTVCMEMCPYKLMDCPKDCKFQKLLIKLVEELS